ncbi:MAG: hydantoin racemase [Streptosporangiales bacterium]|nr:hydantoin racemase [Streptosporangiales bacterium]
MRLAAITPIRVPEEELARRQARYDRLAPPPVRVRLLNLDDPDAPTALNTAADVRRSEELVVAAARDLEPGSYDGVLPDCVLDPGVERLTREAPLPVCGMLRLTGGFLAGHGVVYGSVTRNPAIGDELDDRLRAYRLDSAFVGNAVLDLDFAAVADDARWNAALRDVVAGLAGRGARAVINGCSAVDVADDGSGPDAVVVEPTALALRLVAAGWTEGLFG